MRHLMWVMGIMRWFFNFGCFFTWLIAGYSWARRSPRSPWYPRMQWDKGKFRTKPFLPCCLFTWLCILRSQTKLFSCHHRKAACLNAFFMWLRNAVFPYWMFKNDVIITFSFGQFYSKIALNAVLLTYHLWLNKTKKNVALNSVPINYIFKYISAVVKYHSVIIFKKSF